MRTIHAYLLVLLCTLGSATAAAQGEYSTPYDVAYQYEAEAFDLGNYANFDSLVYAYGNDYHYTKFVERRKSEYPTVNIWDLATTVYGGHPGMIEVFGHSSYWEYDAQAFDSTANGLTNRDSEYQRLKDWYGGDEIDRYTQLNSQGTASYYVIAVKRNFIRNHLYGDSCFVLHIGCHGWELREPYLKLDDPFGHGAKTFVSWDDTVFNSVAMQNSNFMVQNLLNGHTVAQSVAGVSSIMKCYDRGTVMAPQVKAVLPSNMVATATLDSTMVVWINFNTPMDESIPAEEVVTGYNNIRVTDAHWSRSVYGRIVCVVSGNLVGGTGRIVVHGDKALSWSGIRLDGNMSPWYGSNGIAPNGDDFEVLINHINQADDHPWADVSGLSAVSVAGGIQLSWAADERGTWKYLVYNAPSSNGPWSTIPQEVMSNGGHVPYHVLCEEGSWFQLDEVDSTGKVTHIGMTDVSSEFSLVPEDQQYTPEQLDSLQAMVTEGIQQMNRNKSVLLDATPRIVIYTSRMAGLEGDAKNLAPAIQSYMNQTVIVRCVEDIGGAQNIPADFDATSTLNGMVIYASAEDSYGVDGAAYYGNSEMWRYGYTLPTTPHTPHPENNIIGHYYFVTTDSANIAPWGRARFVPTDVPFIAHGILDSLPPIGRWVTRIPVTTHPEAVVANSNAFYAMSLNARSFTHMALWEYDFDAYDNSGAEARKVGDRINAVLQRTSLFQGVVRNVNEPGHVIDHAGRITYFNNSLMSGNSTTHANGTASGEHHIVGFGDLTSGYDPASTPWMGDRMSYVIGPCSIGALGFPFANAVGPCLLDRFFTQYSGKGFWGGFVPGRGVMLYANALIDSAFSTKVYVVPPNQPIAPEAAAAVQREVGLAHPEYRNVVSSYISYGFGRIPYAIPVVGVPDQTSRLTFNLEKPWPNPVTTGRMMLSYSLPKSGTVDLGMFDLQGRRVATFARGTQQSGQYNIHWDGNAKPGVYFVKLYADEMERVHRVVWLR